MWRAELGGRPLLGFVCCGSTLGDAFSWLCPGESLPAVLREPWELRNGTQGSRAHGKRLPPSSASLFGPRSRCWLSEARSVPVTPRWLGGFPAALLECSGDNCRCPASSRLASLGPCLVVLKTLSGLCTQGSHRGEHVGCWRSKQAARVPGKHPTPWLTLALLWTVVLLIGRKGREFHVGPCMFFVYTITVSSHAECSNISGVVSVWAKRCGSEGLERGAPCRLLAHVFS